MEEQMTKISPNSSIPTTSTALIYETPRLTSAQQTAMSILFEDRLGHTIRNWNLFPATHPIWEHCMSILIAEFQQRSFLSTVEGDFAKRAVAILRQQINYGHLKRFFCEAL